MSRTTATLTPGTETVIRDLEGLGPMVAVETHWSGPEPLDRPHTDSVSFGSDSPKTRRLAARYAEAVKAGVVWADPEVVRDVNGQTYVRATSRVLGRTANADLRRLGF